MKALKTLIKKIKAHKRLSFAYAILFIFLLIALFVPFISNNKPLLYKDTNGIQFPVLQKNNPLINWKNTQGDFAIWPLFRYTNTDVDLENAQYVSPFDKQNIESIAYRHWLGTDLIGHDVLAGILYGCRIALIVGFFSMFVSLIIGLLLGSVAGYWADDKIKLNIIEVLVLIPSPFLIYFYGFYLYKFNWLRALNKSDWTILPVFLKSVLISFAIIGLIWLILYIEKKLLRKIVKPKIFLPLDFIISRGIEIFESLPSMFLIIALMAIVKPSLFYVVFIIGLTSWPPIARYTRNELLRIRKLEYIEAARALGFNNLRIILKHALPNAIDPILIALAFGVAGAITAESTLSFLGIGLSVDQVTWGSLLNSARQSPEAWWLVVFPGLMIFLIVFSLNMLGDALVEKMDKRLR